MESNIVLSQAREGGTYANSQGDGIAQSWVEQGYIPEYETRAPRDPLPFHAQHDPGVGEFVSYLGVVGNIGQEHGHVPHFPLQHPLSFPGVYPAEMVPAYNNGFIANPVPIVGGTLAADLLYPPVLPADQGPLPLIHTWGAHNQGSLVDACLPVLPASPTPKRLSLFEPTQQQPKLPHYRSQFAQYCYLKPELDAIAREIRATAWFRAGNYELTVPRVHPPIGQLQAGRSWFRAFLDKERVCQFEDENGERCGAKLSKWTTAEGHVRGAHFHFFHLACAGKCGRTCDKRFSDTQSLQQHVKSIGKKTWCKHCKKEIGARNFERHLQTQHEKQMSPVSGSDSSGSPGVAFA